MYAENALSIRCSWYMYQQSTSRPVRYFLAEMSLRSHRKLFVFIICKNVFRIKVSIKKRKKTSLIATRVLLRGASTQPVCRFGINALQTTQRTQKNSALSLIGPLDARSFIKNDVYRKPDFLEIPYATSLAAKEVINIQKKSSISACGAKELLLVLSDRQNVLTNARMKREGHVRETPYATSSAAKEVANIKMNSLISACGVKELAFECQFFYI